MGTTPDRLPGDTYVPPPPPPWRRRLAFPLETQQDILAERWHARLRDSGPLAYLGSLDVALRAVRSQAGVSQRELATAAGVSKTAVGRFEAGHGGARWDVVLRLLAAAGCRLVIVDRNGDPVLPLRREGVRDLAERELPAHLAARPVPGGDTERRRFCVPLPEHRRPRWEYRRR